VFSEPQVIAFGKLQKKKKKERKKERTTESSGKKCKNSSRKTRAIAEEIFV
jgi:hypothetical protein